MNKWQERFAKKVDSVRQASADRFQQIAEGTLVPVFADFQEFTAQQGIDASDPMTKRGLRTYKFAISENAYVLVTFRTIGLDHCEAHTEFFVPHCKKHKPQIEQAALSGVDSARARQIFEAALDGFMDAYLQSLEQTKGPSGKTLAAVHG
jgi:hypothetical protein